LLWGKIKVKACLPAGREKVKSKKKNQRKLNIGTWDLIRSITN
jgi:hypothetical protein